MAESGLERDDEISLLDLFVVLAENWLLLLVLPLIAGVVAYLAASGQSQTYRSSAIVGLHPGIVTPVLSDGFAEDAIDFSAVEAAPTDIEAALEIIEITQSTSSLDRPVYRTELAVTLDDRGDAQSAVRALLAFLVSAHADGAIVLERDRLASQIAQIGESLALRERSIEQIERAMAEIEAAEPFDAASYAVAASALGTLFSGLDEQRAQIAEFETLSMPLPVELVESEPSSVTMTEGRSPVLMGVLAVLGTGFLLLIFIFAREGLRRVSGDPEGREKLARIRQALLLKRRTA